MEKSILIVDHKPDVCAYLSDLIAYYGYRAECVHSCAEAMRRLEQRGYAAVLLEMWMPDGFGDGVLHWLRSHERQEAVIVISDWADYDLWIDLVEKGAVDLISTPIQPTKFKRALEMALNPRRPAMGPQPVYREGALLAPSSAAVPAYR